MDDSNSLIEVVMTIVKITSIVHLAYQAHKLAKKQDGKPIKNSPREENVIQKPPRQPTESVAEHFFKASTMELVNFNTLFTLLYDKLERFSNRKAIDPVTRLTTTLLYLAQGCNIKDLARAHNLGLSTARKIIYETCDALWEGLHLTYLSPPNVAEHKAIAEQFYIKTGLPNCLGTIDGKDIPIFQPKKKNLNIILLAACDSNYVFKYVDVGAFGSHDSGSVFAKSSFGKKILEGTLEVPEKTFLPGTDTTFPYYFVTDSGFPLKTNLMRPFPGLNLPEDKQRFNTMLSEARSYIENTFGILANRWKVLCTPIQASTTNIYKIVLATLVLHNFLVLKNDRIYFTSDLVDHVENNQHVGGMWRKGATNLRSVRCAFANRASATAFEMRNILKNYLQNNIQ